MCIEDLGRLYSDDRDLVRAFRAAVNQGQYSGRVGLEALVREKAPVSSTQRPLVLRGFVENAMQAAVALRDDTFWVDVVERIERDTALCSYAAYGLMTGFDKIPVGERTQVFTQTVEALRGLSPCGQTLLREPRMVTAFQEMLPLFDAEVESKAPQNFARAVCALDTVPQAMLAVGRDRFARLLFGVCGAPDTHAAFFAPLRAVQAKYLLLWPQVRPSVGRG